jgi:hypothetical protein
MSTAIESFLPALTSLQHMDDGDARLGRDKELLPVGRTPPLSAAGRAIPERVLLA